MNKKNEVNKSVSLFKRHRIFQSIRNIFSRYNREKRIIEFKKKFIEGNSSISLLDLGGNPSFWHFIDRPLHITCVNLPSVRLGSRPPQHDFTIIEGDACSLPQFADGSFDIVFSNSVIEHVGDRKRIAQFASEARRLGRAYWIQTPSKWFPFEAHCGMPFWWFYPEGLRKWFMARWRRRLPNWTKMMEEVTVLERAELEALFPDAEIVAERFLFLTKSYIVVKR